LAFFFIMHLKYIKIIIFLFSFIFSNNVNKLKNDNFFFMELKEQIHVEDNLDWRIISEDENIQILNYKHHNIKIPAIKIVIIDSVNSYYLKEAITNVKNHIKFMQDSYLIISDSLHLGIKDYYGYSNLIFYDTYQYLDLPFIADRHYIARAHILDINDITRINWELLDSKFYSYYNINRDSSIAGIFIDNGFGYWEIEKIDDYITKATYCIYLNPSGWIPSFVINLSNLKVIPNTVINMLKEAKRLQKID